LAKMARYYFHIEHAQPHTDELGEDLPGDAAAWAEALWLMRDVEDRIKPGDKWILKVRRHSEPIYWIQVITEQVASPDERDRG
jgi:hypothetical protein